MITRRRLLVTGACATITPLVPAHKVVAGLDIAAAGADRTVFVPMFYPLDSVHLQETYQLLNRVNQEIERTTSLPYWCLGKTQ